MCGKINKVGFAQVFQHTVLYRCSPFKKFIIFGEWDRIGYLPFGAGKIRKGEVGVPGIGRVADEERVLECKSSGVKIPE